MKLLKYLRIWVILLLLGSAGSVFALEPKVVFEDIEKVYNGLSELPICKEGFSLLEEGKKTVDTQLMLEEEKNIIFAEQLEVVNRKFEACVQVKDAQEEALIQIKDLVEIQAKSYEEVLKASKPSFFDQLKNNSVFIGIGIGLGILLF